MVAVGNCCGDIDSELRGEVFPSTHQGRTATNRNAQQDGLQAAYFDQDRFVRVVELSEAAFVMQSAADAATAASQIHTGRPTLAAAAKRALLSAPVAACAAVAAVAMTQWPVPAAVEAVISVAASLHLPLVLLLFGAGMPSLLPEKRHAPPVRTVLATRQLVGLAVGMVLLLCTPQSLEHAMRSAAIICCLLGPVSRQVRFVCGICMMALQLSPSEGAFMLAPLLP
jgi:predicted permease